MGGDQKRRLIARARAMLMPIRWEEPFGMAVIEALASGTPVVAMRRGAMPVIIEHGVNGFLADSEREFAVLRGHAALLWDVAVSPDGRLVATASQDRAAAVWELATGRLVARLEGHNDQVWSVVFSPDSGSVVTASFDQTARIWDAETGRSMAELRGHLHSVYSASFSPDGRWVLTGSLDNTARVVVCAGCSTALGKSVEGEGVVGLTQALFYAGARCVVLSLWPVHDQPTARLMERFYEALRGGQPPADALRTAKLSVRRDDPAIYGDPYDWAAFVAIGAG